MSNLRHLMNYDNNSIGYQHNGNSNSSNNPGGSSYLSGRNKASISNLIDTGSDVSYNNQNVASINNITQSPPSSLPNYNYNYNTYTQQPPIQHHQQQQQQQQANTVETSQSPEDENIGTATEYDQASTNNAITTTDQVSSERILQSFERIKTHFPAARIKKIMQSDEEIGKVAQATPVVVGRALEIFMANLVEVSVSQAKKQGVKRITASHVKSAIENTEQFDFLMEAVEKYPSLKN
ncbi:hypothetical protein PVL30_003897 [Lodderomyces elongisporus]|uniref:uncharacterized protein n=1 Tax=Lodderomyces elongisporus TaxID=36914 RepID=UPI0029223D69|nr:uncharacterized protein PVL30_003897 [Lodderomyces elongisporus]WLF80122.1 hypothetical protein PVL30_003897 [Lodderomyces elongisporus]